MKAFILFVLFLPILFLSGAVSADDDCTTPVEGWQSREVLRQQLEQKGWEVHRIKVDDGCYEAKGIDSDGNKFEASYEPTSLDILELKIKFQNGADEMGDREHDKKRDKKMKSKGHKAD